MDKSTLWSLRLGFSNKQSDIIKSIGIENFLNNSFKTTIDNMTPVFLQESPNNIKELRERKKKLKKHNPDETKQIIIKEIKVSNEMKAWWIERMITEEYPLLEKMTCFWHNHYVATFEKIKINHWIFQYNQLLREHAFGNFRELTKKVLKSNAMVRYLDNVDNRNEKINENLSRELLELFTLGIGNYTEIDIKNGAKALAGLGIGDDQAIYHTLFENHDTITYLGKTGRFKADDLVDIIFEQPAIPYFITEKILKWFIYDEPTKDLVIYYGNYFKKVNFEIKPFLLKLFSEEYKKDTAGSKIKSPLEFILQLTDELQIRIPNKKAITFFLKEQGMDLFNQPNVKGWKGGKSWLTSQTYLQRNHTADLLCSGKLFNRIGLIKEKRENTEYNFIPHINWKGISNKDIIKNLTAKLLFTVDEINQKDFEMVLKYDFDPESINAEQAILRLFNTIIKTPEFQLI
ncbi:DUF1800 domain-containing protein [Flavobacterium oreochromis]|uniref:DUF1800 domain-containing protein n=2 Tax=Flavobacterium oreochromis TaxID=2906078 RepID=A0ABW8P6J1_9FLAO|nr:hypothetical protein BWG23_08375 [Flavobacterium oreochromis]